MSFLSNLFYIIRIFILVNSACALDLRLVITGIVCYLIPATVSIYKLILKTKKEIKVSLILLKIFHYVITVLLISIIPFFHNTHDCFIEEYSLLSGFITGLIIIAFYFLPLFTFSGPIFTFNNLNKSDVKSIEFKDDNKKS